MAVLLVGEVFTGFCERGTPAVETVGVVNPFAAGLREDISERALKGGRWQTAYRFAIPTYPSWYYYAG